MVRGKKIETPFDGGIAGRIWLAAYMDPRKGYQLAKQVFGTKEESKQPKTPSKIYKYVKDHSDYFRRNEKGEEKIDVNLEKVIETLFAPLRNNVDFEEKTIKTAKEKYRNFLEDFLRGILNVRYANESVIKEEKPLNEISNVTLYLMTTLAGAANFGREIGVDTEDEIEKLLKIFLKKSEISEDYYKPFRNAWNYLLEIIQGEGEVYRIFRDISLQSLEEEWRKSFFERAESYTTYCNALIELGLEEEASEDLREKVEAKRDEINQLHKQMLAETQL